MRGAHKASELFRSQSCRTSVGRAGQTSRIYCYARQGVCCYICRTPGLEKNHPMLLCMHTFLQNKSRDMWETRQKLSNIHTAASELLHKWKTYLIKSKFCPVQEQYFHVNLFPIQMTVCYKHKASRERD